MQHIMNQGDQACSSLFHLLFSPYKQSLNFSVNICHFPYAYQEITLIFAAHVTPSAGVNSKAHESPNHITSLLMPSRRGSDNCSERNSVVRYRTHTLSSTGALGYRSGFRKTGGQAVSSSAAGPPLPSPVIAPVLE